MIRLSCVDFRNQQCHVVFGIRHGDDLSIQPFHLLQHVSITVRLQSHGSRRRGHQQGSGNSFSGYVGNDDLNGVRVDGEIVVIVAAHALGWLHHAGDFKSGNGWCSHGKKHPLDLCSELHVLKKVVPLLLHRFGKQFPLLDVPLNDVNDEREAQ